MMCDFKTKYIIGTFFGNFTGTDFKTTASVRIVAPMQGIRSSIAAVEVFRTPDS